MSIQKRIFILKILIPSLGFAKAGGFRVLSQFANYWIAQGHEVTFLCSSNSIQPYFPTEANIIWFDDKGQQTDVPVVTKKSPLNVFVKQYALYNALNKFAIKSDIILANHSLTALPVSLAKVTAKKFYYIQAYEPDYYAFRNGLIGKFLEKYTGYTYKLKNLIKVVNSPIYYEYKNLKAALFAPCGLDLNTYYPKEKHEAANIIKIGAIGRAEVYKGTTYVLSAFMKLQQTYPNHKFKLYLAFGDKLLESEKIMCPQPQGDEKLAQFYREMDIIIAPGTTQYGAIHYPVIEAMACGIPVITTYYMPATNANAWLVNPHDIDSIITTVAKIIDDQPESQRRAIRAIEDIQQFKWETVSQQMIEYFENQR